MISGTSGGGYGAFKTAGGYGASTTVTFESTDSMKKKFKFYIF